MTNRKFKSAHDISRILSFAGIIVFFIAMVSIISWVPYLTMVCMIFLGIIYLGNGLIWLRVGIFEYLSFAWSFASFLLLIFLLTMV